MKIRHINNIVIELEEWECRALLDFLDENYDRTFIPSTGKALMIKIHDELDKLSQREA